MRCRGWGVNLPRAEPVWEAPGLRLPRNIEVEDVFPRRAIQAGRSWVWRACRTFRKKCRDWG